MDDNASRRGGTSKNGNRGLPATPAGGELLDLTAAQRAMWFAENLDDDHSVTVAHYIDIVDDGRPFDRELFRQGVIEGSRGLQTAYTRLTEVDGAPMQYIDESIPFDVVDVDLRAEPDPLAAAAEWMRADHQSPVDLLHDPVAVAAFIRVADDRTYWYMRGHHIAFDGYGALVGLHEAVARYNAGLRGAAHVPPRRATLAEVIADDAAYRQSARQEKDRDFWTARAADLPERVTLATHPASTGIHNETVVSAGMLGAELDQTLRRCAKDLDASVAAVLTAAFAAFLARMSGGDDIVLSLPVTARTTARVRHSAGMVSNMLPLRIDGVAAATCADVVAAVTREITVGLRHQRYRSEDIRAAAGFGDAAGTSFGPLVNLLLFDKPIIIDGARVSYHMLSAGMVEDLVMNVFAAGPGAPLEVGLHANPALYDTTELETHRRRLLHVLEQFVLHPDRQIADLDLLMPGEQSELDRLGAGEPAAGVVGEHILAAVDRQVAATPDAPALVFGDASMTYLEFARACDGLADIFAAAGVGVGDRVIVALDRSFAQVCAAHAVIGLGAAYVPVDPAEPGDRRDAIAAIVDPVLVVDDRFLAAHEIDVRGIDDATPASAAMDATPRIARCEPLPHQAAYVIFTSGSTGVPKGVEIDHAALEHRLAWMQRDHPIDAADAVLHKTPATFDVSVWELFWPLRTGARMVIAEPGGHRDPAYLRALIDAARVTVLHFVPSMLDAYLDVVVGAETDVRSDETHPGAAAAGVIALPDHVRWVFASGEALSATLARRLREASSAQLVNLYGPTEAAIDVTAHRVTGDGPVVPIGRPVPGTGLRVLDTRLRPVPQGVAGELHLAGPQLAGCYIGAAQQTSARFVADPLGSGGARMYRTGDLVRWTARGELEYLGRTDQQIKIRGQRVELGEVEAVIAAMPGIAAVVVVARRDLGPAPVLVAYVRVHPDAGPGKPGTRGPDDPESVRAHCRRRLPGHMVPLAAVFLDSFPTTRSGKLDQRALPAPEFTTGASTYREPSTPAEEAVVALVAQALGRERVSVTDNLFALGGDSLLAARMVSRARIGHGLTIALTDVFDSDDLADLASRAVFTGADATVGRVRGPVPRPARIPLSQAQTRLWFINRMSPTESTYNMSGALRLTHAVDPDVLRAAVLDVVDRHEILRTVFPVVDGEPEQRILDTHTAAKTLGADVVTVSPAGVDSRARLDDAVSAVTEVGFDLAEEIGFRYRLITGDPDGDVVVLVLHHIAADGHSLRPLLRDLMTAYDTRRAGEEPAFTPLPLQYADVAIERAATLGTPEEPSEALAEGLEFWRTELQGAPDLLQLPTDRPRPRVISSGGAHVDSVLDAELTARIRVLAQSLSVTPFAVFQSALAITLGRLASTDDVSIGTAVAGRDDPAVADLVGMFVNTVVLRTPIRPAETVRELVTAAHRRCARAMSHADVPFERVVDAVAPHRSPSHSPLFQVALTVQPDQLAALSHWTGSAEVLDARVPSAKYDLTVSVTDRAEDYAVEFAYATDLFDAETVQDLAGYLRRVLTQMVAGPDRATASLDLLEPAMVRALTEPPRGVQRESTLADLIAAGIAAADPASAALTGAGTLNWSELSTATHQIARVLIDRGLGPGDVVAVSIPRSPRSVLALLGVAMSGAAFVMVDPRLPAARRAAMLADSGACLVISVGSVPTHTGHDAGAQGRTPGHSTVEEWHLDDLEAELSIAGRPTHPVSDDERVRPMYIDDLAYLLFTSGSTGRPKAAAVTHAGLAEMVAEQQRLLGVTSASRVLHVAAPGFDVAVWEIVLAVCASAELVISPPEVFAGPELETVIARHRVTHAIATPTALATVEPSAVPDVEVMMTAGEACPPELVTRWDAGGRPLLNLYGPTETTIWVTTSAPLRSNRPITIGGPISGAGIKVLDAGLRPVPPGVIGELYLSGRVLGRGYHGRPDQSATRFVADPFDAGARMYRTGDLVSLTRSNELIYHGRNDFQIKIRGMRVEPGEVDGVLVTHPDVENAVSVGALTPAGDTVLVSYVTAVAGRAPAPEDILDHAVARLPGHLVPHTVQVLDALPVTRTGKVDRRALPAVEISPAREYVAPRSRLEAVVAQIFADVLGLREVSVHDGFFELGGSSLSATKVTYRVEQHIGQRVALALLFENPTVASFVAAVGNSDAAGVGRMLTPRDRKHMVELTGVQRGLWSLNQIDPSSSAYNIGLTLDLEGRLDVAALTGAVGDIVARHESLRTRYPVHEGVPVQIVLPAAEALRRFGVDVIDISVTGDATDERVEDEIAAVVEPGFDLTDSPAVRAAVLRLRPERHLLVFVVHHINADGESLGALARDLTEAYAARISGHTGTASTIARPLRVQFADYAIWHAERLQAQGPDGATEEQRQLEYWQHRLGTVREVATLASDRPRPAEPRHLGGVVDLTIPSSTATILRQIARVNNTTQFVVMHAALAVLIGRLSGTDDVVIGTPFAGRDDPALADMVGMLATTVPLRTTLRLDESFDDLLRRVRTDDFADLGNSDVSFDQIVDHLTRTGSGAARRGRHNPLFSVMLSYQNLRLPEVELEGLHVRPRPPASFPAKVDLELMLYPGDLDGIDRDGALGGQIAYDTDLFDHATVEKVAERYRTLLADIAARPGTAVGDLAIWTGGESSSAATDPAGAHPPLHEIVSRVAASAPEAVIGVPGAPEVTFADLEATAVAMSISVPDEDPAEALTIAVATLLADADRTIDEVFDSVRAAAEAVMQGAGSRNRVGPA
ncbi:amino acid adenylation domain-containing protein [Gordonia jinghuaiqii]|uniref:Amino acid adenylation domain-containing protein n=1 Tax=Gordonia jinghuaiqii TaxID=2758710 RepID=A0A7D7LRS7_9ACTN|nr:non-ribosomal peptide synthetase [Gordonia jinghuaiqii]MCR5977410.1 amino acid adenylation domain-containing protein [Gordonia jinghuaiqii]QMT00017.1 amino acid adenylation domain-containing protein [Gordonia jinghuaiqii]